MDIRKELALNKALVAFFGIAAAIEALIIRTEILNKESN